MGKLTRFGVSLDGDLLEPFDLLCKHEGYANRSEAIRDLIRSALTRAGWGASGIGAGTLTLVYDHHKNDLARGIMRLQHEHHDIIVTTMHVHMDHENCLEVLVLKGAGERILALAQKLVARKGVKYGVFNPVPNGGDLA